MADLSKLKRRNTLGTPPSLDEASQNLMAPETAPIEVPAAAVVAPTRTELSRRKERGRVDGRSMRRTGRDLQFSTRVSVDWDDKLRMIAGRDELKFVEILERGLDAYEILKEIATREGLAVSDVLERGSGSLRMSLAPR